MAATATINVTARVVWPPQRDAVLCLARHVRRLVPACLLAKLVRLAFVGAYVELSAGKGEPQRIPIQVSVTLGDDWCVSLGERLLRIVVPRERRS